MSRPREVICPTCGAAVPIDDASPVELSDLFTSPTHTIETIVPGTRLEGEDVRLADDATAEYDRREAARPAESPTYAGNGADYPLDEHRLGPDPLASPDPDTPPLSPIPLAAFQDEVLAAPALHELHPASGLPPIQLDVAAELTTSSPRRAEGSFTDEHAAPPRSWSRLLLRSYASALTLGCLWLLWLLQHPGSRPAMLGGGASTSIANFPDEEGVRSDRSYRLPPSVPVPADHLAKLGQSIRLGDLDITPVEISTGDLVLDRVSIEGNHESRVVGPGSLFLRLKLRNVSAHDVFAPLDEAFLREPEKGWPHSYIESPSSPAKLYPYQLPVASEWTIRGQALKELKPGEALDTLVASDVNALPQLPPSPIWRIQLRTGPQPADRADVGVPFMASDLAPAPPKPRS